MVCLAWLIKPGWGREGEEWGARTYTHNGSGRMTPHMHPCEPRLPPSLAPPPPPAPPPQRAPPAAGRRRPPAPVLVCVIFVCVLSFRAARTLVHSHIRTHTLSLSLVHHTDLLLLLLLLLLAEEERGGGEEAQGHLQRPAVHLFLCCRRGVVLSRERPWWCWSGGMSC